jgi:hypothetical protein
MPIRRSFASQYWLFRCFFQAAMSGAEQLWVHESA